MNNTVDRTKNSRMGWSDVALCLEGGITESLTEHFVDRWCARSILSVCRILTVARNYLFEAKYSEKNGTRYKAMDAPDKIEEIGKSVNHAVGSLRKRFARGLRGLGRKKPVDQPQDEKLQIQLTRR